MNIIGVLIELAKFMYILDNIRDSYHNLISQ